MQPEVMEQLGDKIAAKKLARSIDVPVIEDAILSIDASHEVTQRASHVKNLIQIINQTHHNTNAPRRWPDDAIADIVDSIFDQLLINFVTR